MDSRDTEFGLISPPPYRHAVPSAPWPWIDVRDGVDQKQLKSEAPPVPRDCDHSDCQGTCWKQYPQSRFPNWTHSQVTKSGIRDAIDGYDRKKKCMIYKLDVDKKGVFRDAGELVLCDGNALLDNDWDRLKDDHQTSDIRMRALFVESMTGPVLQMIGAKYNVEPVFFSSSLNGIPSHFQEDLRHNIGDHITVTLPFIQLIDASALHLEYDEKTKMRNSSSIRRRLLSQTIDVQAPLRLEYNNKALISDLLSVYLVRNVEGNTLISFHANMGLPTTKASYLHERILYAGRSVYWQRVLNQTNDPTFLLLIFVWHTIYAWGEAFQHLYEHICVVESEVIKVSSNDFTDGLHVIRAHLLHYSSLLSAFRRTINFVSNTPNPALSPDEKDLSDQLLRKECTTLLEEIDRLDKECAMQDSRLKYVVDLVDSKFSQRMTEAATRDSAVMKQISYLTMVFLPATFLAGFFGIHMQEIDSGETTLALYFTTTCVLTAATIWILGSLQSDLFHPEASFWKRLGWPIYLVYYAFGPSKKFDAKFKEGILPK